LIAPADVDLGGDQYAGVIQLTFGLDLDIQCEVGSHAPLEHGRAGGRHREAADVEVGRGGEARDEAFDFQLYLIEVIENAIVADTRTVGFDLRRHQLTVAQLAAKLYARRANTAGPVEETIDLYDIAQVQPVQRSRPEAVIE